MIYLYLRQVQTDALRPLFNFTPTLLKRGRPSRPARPAKRVSTCELSPLLDFLALQRFELSVKDPFGEWRNYWQHGETVRMLEGLDHDYFSSVGWVRANRPEGSGDALRFWNAGTARAHLLNAIFLRDRRTLAQVQADVKIPRDKLYQYFTRWDVDFVPRRRRVMVQDADGTLVPGDVTRFFTTLGRAHIRVEGYTQIVEGRYDRISHLYRTHDVLPIGDALLLPLFAAAHLLNLRPATLRKVAPARHRSNAGVALFDLGTLARVVSPERWGMSPEEALKEVNPCRCVFFDQHLGACGLGNPLIPGCEDWSKDFYLTDSSPPAPLIGAA